MFTLMVFLTQAYSRMARRGPRPLVLCGPSGSGKSTLLKRLFAEFPETFGFSVSHTTRKPRPGEENGVHYHFVERDDMKAAIAKGEFLETAEFSGNMYGTSKQAVRNVQDAGKVCVLDIEIEGVKQIRNSDLDPLLAFVMPPSIDELKRRLVGRNTETQESLQKRLDTASREIEYGKTEGNFHTIILNHDVDKAYKELRDFILKELKQQQAHGVYVCLKTAADK
ncbi:guanylate kinase isoform X2 [Contarinia nasturtii]|uniref:guanylate kinase isoform X2 n=1 Tax=Contarinia nasturtii TaxID=265458 RepID=UPI0012D45EF9|nr:guanylate kinase isoform X2 [Contarinia nasturtii]